MISTFLTACGEDSSKQANSTSKNNNQLTIYATVYPLQYFAEAIGGDSVRNSCHQLPRSPRFEMFEMRRLRIDQQSGRDGEGRPLGRFRQTGNSERPADADRTAEDARRKFRQAGELARAAGQHHAAARLGRERRRRQPVAHHFENLLDARPDDAHQRRARHELRRLAIVVADRAAP